MFFVPTELEALLYLFGVIKPPDRARPTQKKADSEDELSDGSADEGFSGAAAAKVNGRAPKNIRNSQKKDEDSDSDFDL